MGNLLFFDGFDEVPQSGSSCIAYLGQAKYIGSAGIIGNSEVRVGDGRSIKSNTSTGTRQLYRYVTSRAEVVAGMAFRTYSNDGIRRIMSFAYDNLVGTRSVICHVAMNGVAGISILNHLTHPNTPVLIAASDDGNIIQPGVWHYVECKINVVTGSITVRVDGEVVLTKVGGGAIRGGFSTLNCVGFFQDFLENHLATIDSADQWDDFYIHEDTFQGDVVVTTLHTNGAGDSTDVENIVGAYANNWQAVGEDEPYSDGDSNFVYSDTDEARDLYTFENLPAYALDIIAVANWTYARKTTVGAGALKQVAKVGSDVHLSDTKGITTVYAQDIDLMVEKPGGGAWTIIAVNGMQVGFEVVGS